MAAAAPTDPAVLALTGTAMTARWNAAAPIGTSTVVTYSFGAARADYDSPARTGFAAFSAVMQAATREALAAWAAVSGLVFVEVPPTTGSQLRFGLADMAADTSGYAFFPNFVTVPFGGADSLVSISNDIGGDVFLSRREFLNQDGKFAEGQRGFAVLLHEIGHALGFKHPFEGTPTLGPEEDNSLTTIMSYKWIGTPTGLGTADVGAVRHYYGTTGLPTAYDPATGILTRSGTEAGEWLLGTDLDDRMQGLGGADTLFSDDGRDWLDGGAGDDSLSGGGFADTLLGGEGADTLWGDDGDDLAQGGAGADSLAGGLGADTLEGGAGDDTYRVDSTADVVTERAGEGSDMVFASVSLYLPAEVEGLTLVAGAAYGVGNALANRITGDAAENLLLGAAGDDSLAGGAAADVLYGQAGDDSLAGGDGLDYLFGGDGADTLAGGADADALFGEAGDDSLGGGAGFVYDMLVGGAGDDTLDGASGAGDYDALYGGAGDDHFLVDTPADLVFEFAGAGHDTVFARITGAGYYLYEGIEDLVLLEATPFGVGNALANALTGSAGANWLLGGAGDDTLDGGAGVDVLFGEAGADRFILRRGTGGEVIGDFAPGVDRIDLAGLGFAGIEAVRAAMTEYAGSTAIDLGAGDFAVVLGVAKAAFGAADFLYG